MSIVIPAISIAAPCACIVVGVILIASVCMVIVTSAVHIVLAHAIIVIHIASSAYPAAVIVSGVYPVGHLRHGSLPPRPPSTDNFRLKAKGQQPKSHKPIALANGKHSRDGCPRSARAGWSACPWAEPVW
jgi:hypothetical protein